jgi:uncharacterized membrane protein
MNKESAGGRRNGWGNGRGAAPDNRASGRMQLLVSACVGLVAGGLVAALGPGMGRIAPLIGWDVLAVVFCAWVWATVWPLGAHETARHALREDPGRELTDLLMIGASLASLVAVGAVLFGAGHAQGNAKYLQAAFALASVFVSWTIVHTVFTLKYARLYYAEPVGGIDFNQPNPARYSDFAYLAFTLGMTFQVSDTDIGSTPIRRAALRHALLSYPLGAVIIAAAINLVSGLAK